ncbi:MAG TPA: hypothetical protein IGR64_15465 [Leptolyngbyaceae cyanobacterium M65_K2018_010]|nr:hypothetical protein [Leptolyngbyaceae cyanobacterium M65_K2018_010]
MGPVLLSTACQPIASEDASNALDKINFDLNELDDNGLYGPPDGLRSLDYEFCIPEGEVYAQAVKAIDPSLNFYPHSRGRIGCTDGQVLAIGNTHQPNAQDILLELANLDYIERIEPVVWE